MSTSKLWAGVEVGCMALGTGVACVHLLLVRAPTHVNIVSSHSCFSAFPGTMLLWLQKSAIISQLYKSD